MILFPLHHWVANKKYLLFLVYNSIYKINHFPSILLVSFLELELLPIQQPILTDHKFASIACFLFLLENFQYANQPIVNYDKNQIVFW